MNDPQENAMPTGKISLGDAGLGTVTLEMVEQRAREIALTDGRKNVNEADRDAARHELLGPPDHESAPETADSLTENLVEWDEPVDADGQRAHTVRADDNLGEMSLAETLVEEGMEEAEHNQRLSAARENPPEEDE